MARDVAQVDTLYCACLKPLRPLLLRWAPALVLASLTMLAMPLPIGIDMRTFMRSALASAFSLLSLIPALLLPAGVSYREAQSRG